MFRRDAGVAVHRPKILRLKDGQSVLLFICDPPFWADLHWICDKTYLCLGTPECPGCQYKDMRGDRVVKGFCPVYLSLRNANGEFSYVPSILEVPAHCAEVTQAQGGWIWAWRVSARLPSASSERQLTFERLSEKNFDKANMLRLYPAWDVRDRISRIMAWDN